jgi:uncharacterized protein YggU (UPF0235/DUF167 family)
VAPGSARSEVVGRHGTGWKLRVSAPPVDGRANEAVERLLADALALPARDVGVVSGHGARDKTVALAGIEPAEAERRLARACGGEDGS